MPIKTQGQKGQKDNETGVGVWVFDPPFPEWTLTYIS